MTKTPKRPKPRKTRPPMPGGGGSYLRQPDGSLVKTGADPAQPARKPTAKAATFPSVKGH